MTDNLKTYGLMDPDNFLEDLVFDITNYTIIIIIIIIITKTTTKTIIIIVLLIIIF